jgi:hypothetical protein
MAGSSGANSRAFAKNWYDFSKSPKAKAFSPSIKNRLAFAANSCALTSFLDKDFCVNPAMGLKKTRQSRRKMGVTLTEEWNFK